MIGPNATTASGERAMLRYLLEQYDRLLAVHEQVRMDTPEDRELHADAIATFRQVAEPARAVVAASCLWCRDPNAGDGDVLPEDLCPAHRDEYEHMYDDVPAEEAGQ